MRKASLDSLFPQVRQKILAATLMQPEKWWYLTELASHLGVTPSTLQRELSSLSQSGVLEKRNDGNRIYYRPDQSCPFILELQGIVVKTVGLADIIKGMLRSFADQISCAFVFGSIAKSEELSASDIDLMIVGSVPLTKLSSHLKRLEKQTGRAVNVVVVTAIEFRSKLLAKNHFFTQIMADKKIFLIGNGYDLERIAGN